MSLGLVGRKVGMMRIFKDDGTSVPVTVLDCAGNRVTQIKTQDTDGYVAVQVAFGKRRATRVTKAMAGHFAKAGVEAGTSCANSASPPTSWASSRPAASSRSTCSRPARRSTSPAPRIGKGFAGVIKRHHFSSNRASHGNSLSHNSAGSIGMAQDPGRVFPGKRMAGHLGNVKRTIQLLEVARVDAERSLIMIKGSVPGAKNGAVIVRPA